MSTYSLKSKAGKKKWDETVADLITMNHLRVCYGKKAIPGNGPSIKKLEQCVCSSLEGFKDSELPTLLRGIQYYREIIKHS